MSTTTTPMVSPLMTPAEVCEQLGITAAELDQLRAGGVRVTTYGLTPLTLRYDRADIEDHDSDRAHGAAG
jgi:hypothetical protein